MTAICPLRMGCEATSAHLVCMRFLCLPARPGWGLLSLKLVMKQPLGCFGHVPYEGMDEEDLVELSH